MMKVLILAGILMLAIACASATVYTVGGDLGWTGPPNITVGYYDSWAANKTFKGGDALSKQSSVLCIIYPCNCIVFYP